MHALHYTVEKRYTPAAVATAETKTIMRIPKGHRLTKVSLKMLVCSDAGSTNTVSLGDTSGVTAISATVATKSDGANPVGTLVQSDSNLPTHGKLYTADDSLKVDYVKGATASVTAAPTIMVVAEFEREWPQ